MIAPLEGTPQKTLICPSLAEIQDCRDIRRALILPWGLSFLTNFWTAGSSFTGETHNRDWTPQAFVKATIAKSPILGMQGKEQGNLAVALCGKEVNFWHAPFLLNALKLLGWMITRPLPDASWGSPLEDFVTPPLKWMAEFEAGFCSAHPIILPGINWRDRLLVPPCLLMYTTAVTLSEWTWRWWSSKSNWKAPNAFWIASRSLWFKAIWASIEDQDPWAKLQPRWALQPNELALIVTISGFGVAHFTPPQDCGATTTTIFWS